MTNSGEERNMGNGDKQYADYVESRVYVVKGSGNGNITKDAIVTVPESMLKSLVGNDDTVLFTIKGLDVVVTRGFNCD